MTIKAYTEELEAMDRASLITAWQELFGRLPAAKTSMVFMINVLAYEWQARQHDRHRLKELNKTLGRIAGGLPVKLSGTTIKPGTSLIRMWQGQRVQVDVTDNGKFCWNGTDYRSLSAIAKQITGTNRNGPRFFGLRTR